MRILTLIIAVFMATTASAQEMRSITDASGTTIEIPVQPQRIVSMGDQGITLPLIELGAPVVGSYGRVSDDGSLYMRAVDLVLWHRF